MSMRRRGGRRWFRFGLRTLFVMLTAFCIFLVVFAARLKRARDQKVAVGALLEAKAFVFYDYQRNNFNAPIPGPKWLREVVGDDFFRTAVKVDYQKTHGGPSRVTDETLRNLSALPYLEELSLCDAAVSTEGLIHVRGLNRLQRLTLLSMSSNVSLGEQRLSFLRGLENLRVLNFYGVEIRDADLAALDSLQELEEIRLNQTSVSTEGLIHVCGLKRLQILGLGSTSSTVPGNGTGLANIAHLSELRELELVNVPLGEQRLSFLRGLENLRVLNLCGVEIRDADLAALGSLRGLEEITLNQTSIGDEGLTHLRPLTRLKVLRLASTNITDSGLKDLQSLPAVTLLSLSGTDIGDEGVQYLVAMKHLCTLSLADTDVSDEGVRYLLTMKHLRTLRIYQTRVTASGVAQLRRELKNCEIEP